VPLLSWGAHICMFYDTTEDLLDTHIDYFGAGLEDNEYCVWAYSDPIDRNRAETALRHAIPRFDDFLAMGAIELIPGYDWYLGGSEFDAQRITGDWHAKLDRALAAGFEGLRVSGNAFWMQANLWHDFHEYEQELDRSLADARMIVLCTYAMDVARTVDFLDVARTHQFSIARRQGRWEFLETSELTAKKQETGRDGANDILSRPFPGHDLLTPRERTTLGQIVRGASNKEAARELGISPRTAEFHRANIMRKLDVRNAVELVGMVLGQNGA
jgi:DNA-binding CsgD family transcriptional regulator